MTIKDAKGYWDLTDDSNPELSKVAGGEKCGCVTGIANPKIMSVDLIAHVYPKPMSVCQADKKLN
jgi:hypothetical protein